MAFGFFSRICDQRLSIIGQMRDQIMMGQPRQRRNTYSVEDDLEEEERHGAGCVCVFLASGYGWVTVIHETPISSAQPLTSLPYPRTQ